MTEKTHNITISQSLFDKLNEIAVQMKIPAENLIEEALNGYIDLNDIQCKEIERRLNDHSQDRFASEAEMEALFGKYRNAH